MPSSIESNNSEDEYEGSDSSYNSFINLYNNDDDAAEDEEAEDINADTGTYEFVGAPAAAFILPAIIHYNFEEVQDIEQIQEIITQCSNYIQILQTCILISNISITTHQTNIAYYNSQLQAYPGNSAYYNGKIQEAQGQLDMYNIEAPKAHMAISEYTNQLQQANHLLAVFQVAEFSGGELDDSGSDYNGNDEVNLSGDDDASSSSDSYES